MRRLLLALLFLSVSAPAVAQVTNALTAVFYISADGDCDNDPCTSPTRQLCRESATATVVYMCNSTTGFYVPAAGGTTTVAGNFTLTDGNLVLLASGALVDGKDISGQAAMKNEANAFVSPQTMAGDLTMSTASAKVDGRNLDRVPATPRVVHVCASGCEETTLNSACTNNTSTCANPIRYELHGVFAAANTMCDAEACPHFHGDGVGVTVLTGVDHGFGSGSGNDCVATPNNCKAALNLGTSTDVEISGITFKGNQGVRANNVGGVGGGNVNIYLSEFIPITGNGDEDCAFFSAVQDNTAIHWNHNRCSTNSDGFTYGASTGAGTAIYMSGNTWEWSATAGTGRVAPLNLSSIPCTFYSSGDQFIMSGDRNTDIIAAWFVGTTPGCSSGKAVMAAPIISVTNTNATAGNAFGVFVASDATELVTLDLIAPSITTAVPNNASGASVAIFQQTQTTTSIGAIGGSLVSTGGNPSSRSCFSPPGGTQTVTADTFCSTAVSTTVTIEPMAGINYTNSTGRSATFVNAASDPTILMTGGAGIFLKMDNTTGGGGNAGPIQQFCDNQGTEQCWGIRGAGGGALSNGVFGVCDITGTEECSVEFQPNLGTVIFNTSIAAKPSPASSGFLYLSTGNGESDMGLFADTSTNDGFWSWKTSVKTWAGDGEAIRIGGITTAATVATAGDFTIDTSDNGLVWYSGGAVRHLAPLLMETIPVLAPTSASDPVWFRAPWPITVSNIDCIVDPEGTAESVVITVRECDGNGDSCAGLDGATTITCGNTNTADDGALSNPTIDTGDWIDIDTGTVTGTVTRLAITIRYTQDRQ